MRFDPARRAYWDETTNAFVPSSRMIQFREDIVAAFSENAATISDQLAHGEISLDTWSRDFRSLVRRANESQFVLARGGESQMTTEDWSIVDARVASQEPYISRLGNDIVSGGISAEMAKYRSTLYASATRSAFEQGRSRAWTHMRMPAYPGDGSTECRTGCKCRWDYRMEGDEVHATWKLGPSEHCPGCSTNAMRYNPYIVTPT